MAHPLSARRAHILRARIPIGAVHLLAVVAYMVVVVGHVRPALAAGEADYIAAQEALQRGDFRTAVAELDKLANDRSLTDEARANVLANRAQAKMSLEDFDGALIDFQAVIQIEPSAPDAWTNIGTIYEQRRRYHESITYHRSAVKHALAIQTPTPHPIITLNNLAWLLATCPLENCRNGQLAVESSLKSLELLKAFPSADGPILSGHFDTLAAAYAETGDFAQAVKAAEEAIALAGEGFPERKMKLAQRLQSYRAGKPWRLPAP
jgi:tetratricopeptide (TPR) repeat protein